MAKAEKKKLTGRKRDERVAAYIFVAPAVILLIAFLVVPMIYTVYFSGFKYQIMRPDAMKFILKTIRSFSVIKTSGLH